MSIAVALTNHNQHKQVRQSIEALLKCKQKPDIIYVMSDGKPMPVTGEYPNVVIINNGPEMSGRCSNRNSVIKPFLESGMDKIIFMDGDCMPDGRDFIEKYDLLLDNYDLIFGTRTHTDVSKLKNPPSDLLTANMDNMYHGKKLDYTDLRVVSGAVRSWAEAKTFEEKLDLMLTGMIGWSCNFGFTRKGIQRLRKFQVSNYGLGEGIFDSGAFMDGWGYEDVAMGIDALYAGLNIHITDTVKVLHQSHDRTDNLFDHVKGRHSVMNRYRMVEKSLKLWDDIKKIAIIASAFFTAGLITGMVTYAVAAENLF